MNSKIIHKPRYLFVLASSSQLYSGTGTAIFEWIKYARNHFDFAICIDNDNPYNYRIARTFCQDNGLPFLPSAPFAWDGGPDPGNAWASTHLNSGYWQLVEAVSWANATLNHEIVDACNSRVPIIYTPHTQPAWTMPNSDRYWALEGSFVRMLEAASLICCDSPAELETITDLAPGAKAKYIPIGVNTAEFCPSTDTRKSQILIVADFNEKRKRTDLSLAAIDRLFSRSKLHSAVLAGKNSEHVSIPTSQEARILRAGYIDKQKLIELYASSQLFLLLSDYEAFGIPIVEALSCGTPVVTTDTREARSLFGNLPGCHLVDNTDENAVDAAIDRALQETDHLNISRSTANQFNLEATFSLKMNAIQSILNRLERPQSNMIGTQKHSKRSLSSLY
ncbi:glycosyltransferase family 4 protein [Segnochrobactrum spirostomi]|nr:glycosyltransferase family 4 protein [Segnochrobactrum spirostomi]